jgi:shikimate dehydrogenase
MDHSTIPPQIMQFGLIGYPLGHSFSKKYFSEKFKAEAIAGATYELFPIEEIEQLSDLLAAHPNLQGLNVTIPYKKAVINYLDELDETALTIGAVNCIAIHPDGYLKGYNTDATGFEQSLRNTGDGKWATAQTTAVVLGDGGAANAVVYVLKKLGMAPVVVSRKGEKSVFFNSHHVISWDELPEYLGKLTSVPPAYPVLIVNTTPVGMAPDVESCPQLPFDTLGPEHLVFDLIYNPEETLLLQQARRQRCSTLNGLEMLHLQAEAAWKIWCSIL